MCGVGYLGAAAVAVAIMRSGNELLSCLLHGLHPEGKHLACRHRQPDEEAIKATPVAKRLIRTAIMEMMAADRVCMMLLGAITSNVFGQKKKTASAIT